MRDALWRGVLALGLLLGCGDDDGATTRDSGTDVGPVWMPPDSGLMLRDAARDAAGSSCMRPRLDPFPAEALPRCTAETAVCVQECGETEGCADVCRAEDTMPRHPELGGCADCVIFDLLACFDAAGCDQQVAEVFCCGESECPPGSAEDCFDVMCQPQLMALFSCGFAMGPTCLEDFTGGTGGCFADAPIEMDAGMDAAVDMDGGADIDAGMDAAMDAGVDGGE